ncbi:MAG: orotate phosphoribosyltransferase [Oscillospiraceae bacterium]|nr:orotate phosphoribosyltransferase [Oscillospiraceae bacterium]
MEVKSEIAKSLLEIGAVFLRPSEPFTWASGIKSPIYCDIRVVLSYPEIRSKVEAELARKIQIEFPNAQILAGTSTGGIAHAALAADILQLPMVYVRSGQKNHGRQKLIEGHVAPQQSAVVVEDLISTCGSSLAVVNALQTAGIPVLGIAAIFSYGLQAAFDACSNAAVRCFSLLDYETLIAVALQNRFVNEQEAKKLQLFHQDPQSSNWMHA